MVEKKERRQQEGLGKKMRERENRFIENGNDRREEDELKEKRYRIKGIERNMSGDKKVEEEE